MAEDDLKAIIVWWLTSVVADLHTMPSVVHHPAEIPDVLGLFGLRVGRAIPCSAADRAGRGKLPNFELPQRPAPVPVVEAFLFPLILLDDVRSLPVRAIVQLKASHKRRPNFCFSFAYQFTYHKYCNCMKAPRLNSTR